MHWRLTFKRAGTGGAVSRVLFAWKKPRGQSSIWDSGHPKPRAAYPQLDRFGPNLVAYLALLRLGVTLPRLLPGARWALTPPFHPYPDKQGGMFSVVLSVAFRRPGVTWQPALWSSDFPQQPPRCLPRPPRPTLSYLFPKGKGFYGF